MIESKIISQKKNPLLDREEILVEIVNKVTPSFDEVKGIFGKDGELTVVKKIKANFGRYNFIAEVVVYNSNEVKEKVEVIPKKVRKKIKEELKKKAEEEKKKAEEIKKVEEEKSKESLTEETPSQ